MASNFHIQLWAACIEHENGSNHYLQPTREDLYAALAEFCEEHKRDAGDQPGYATAKTGEDKVTAYFDGSHGESLNIGEVTLQLPVDLVRGLLDSFDALTQTRKEDKHGQ